MEFAVTTVVGGSTRRHRIIVLETIPRHVVTIEVRCALYGNRWSIVLTEMTTRVSVATRFSGMANPAPVELLAAGYTNPARIQINPQHAGTVEGSLVTRPRGGWLAPGPRLTGGKASTAPCLPLFGWRRRSARPSRRLPGRRISLGGPEGEARPPAPALAPQQQLPPPSPPR
jgi:hypothetical protein